MTANKKTQPAPYLPVTDILNSFIAAGRLNTGNLFSQEFAKGGPDALLCTRVICNGIPGMIVAFGGTVKVTYEDNMRRVADDNLMTVLFDRPLPAPCGDRRLIMSQDGSKLVGIILSQLSSPKAAYCAVYAGKGSNAELALAPEQSPQARVYFRAPTP